MNYTGGSNEEYTIEPQRVFENTYETKPRDGQKFEHGAVSRVIRLAFDEMLVGKSYDAAHSAELSKALSDEILAKVKALNYGRYKLVCQVTIGQNKGQGIREASRCLWDTEKDNFASESFQNASLFVTAVVFGTYFD